MVCVGYFLGTKLNLSHYLWIFHNSMVNNGDNWPMNRYKLARLDLYSSSSVKHRRVILEMFELIYSYAKLPITLWQTNTFHKLQIRKNPLKIFANPLANYHLKQGMGDSYTTLLQL